MVSNQLEMPVARLLCSVAFAPWLFVARMVFAGLMLQPPVLALAPAVYHLLYSLLHMTALLPLVFLVHAFALAAMLGLMALLRVYLVATLAVLLTLGRTNTSTNNPMMFDAFALFQPLLLLLLLVPLVILAA